MSTRVQNISIHKAICSILCTVLCTLPSYAVSQRDTTFVFGSTSFSSPPTTPEISDLLVRSVVQHITSQENRIRTPHRIHISTATYQLQPSELQWLFASTPLSGRLRSSPSSGMTTPSDSGSLVVQSIRTYYTRTETNMLMRIMKINTIVQFPCTPNSSIIRCEYRDTVSAAQTLILQTRTFPFFYAEIPPENSSFIDTISEPAIVIGSAVLSVLLFFFIRTQ